METNIPPNELGIFFTDSEMSMEDNLKIINGPLKAAEPKLKEELNKPLDLTTTLS